MNRQWAFHWVLWLHHHKRSMGLIFLAVTIALAAGVPQLPLFDNPPVSSSFAYSDWSILAISLVAMSGLAGYLMMSWRSALLLLGVSSMIVIMVLGAMGWLNVSFNLSSDQQAYGSLALIVVMTMMMSNLIHLITAVHREMARGQFQHDALGDAIQLNAQPIVLSNVTTVLSFMVAAYFDASIQSMAWIVGLGALMSLWVTFTWLPWILLNWFIECRVGEPKDRYGLLSVVQWLESHPTQAKLVVWLGAVLGLASLYVLSNRHSDVGQLLAMMAGLFLFLWLVWKRALYAILTSGLALYTLLVIGALVSLLASEPLSVWLLIVPMGLIIDDAIHFFVRYLRAKQGFFQSSEQAVRFTMASIGRPIWVTSLVLLVGVSVLTTSSNPLIRLESWVVVASLLLMTFFVLVLVPALLMKSHK